MVLSQYTHVVERQSLVAPRSRLVYVPTPKVACTSLKSAVVDLEGARKDVFGAGPEQTEQQSIHDPSVYSLRSLAQLSAAERDEALTDERWVRFCLTRDPYDRVLSAWANKVLLGGLGGPLDEQLAEVGLPGVGSTESVDLGVMFRAFVHRLSSNDPRFGDDHLAPQVTLLDVDRFPYTHIVDLSDLDHLLAELRSSHPSRAGFVLGPRANEGLRLRSEDLYDADTAAVIESLYAADFRRFGYACRSFPKVARPMMASPNELMLVSMVRERNDRIAALSGIARSRTSGRYGLSVVVGAVGTRLRGLRSSFRR